MLASALQLLPSARLLAAFLVAVAGALHWFGSLPQRGWLAPMALALPVLLALGWWAARRAPAGEVHALPAQTQLPGRRRWQRPLLAIVALARFGAGLLVVGLLILWQVHQALQARLPAALEGRDLEVTGVVDGMAQRFDYGDRVRFTLASCRIARAADAPENAAGQGDRSSLAGASPCGTLERLQLDWGPLREKDRHAFDGGDRAAEPADDVIGNASDASDESAKADDVWPQPGQYWRLAVRLRRPVAPANPGGFDLELRYLQQGVGALGRVYARQRLESLPEGGGWWAWSSLLIAFESLRARLRDGLESVHAHRIEAPGADRTGRWPLIGVVAGLALGDQGAISATLWGLFSRTGVSHLMAISGMHVTMLALIAAWLASRALRLMTRCRVPGIARLLSGHPRQFLVLIIAVLTAFAYALLSGWGIPSQRTCWMLTAAAVLSLLGRGAGPLDITLIAAAVVIAADPWAVSTAGFWLSFGAVAAILWCAHGQDSERVLRMSFFGVGSTRVPLALRDAFTSQWAATIGLAPLVIALFSTLSLIGPLANAVAIPWVSFLVTPLAVAAALLAPVSAPACALLLQANLWLIEQLVAMLQLLDRLPAASVAIARPSPWTLVAAVIGAVVLIAPAGMPMRGAGVLCLLQLLFAPQRLPSDDELWITVLDIGQGSSILVESADQRLLFDAGAGHGVDRSAASRFLVPYLRSRGIEAIDTLVISHLDIEHAGGAAAVLQALRPARLLTSFDARFLQVTPPLLAGVRSLPCTSGGQLALGAATIDMLYPPAGATLRNLARDNRSSCVLRISSPAGSVLLPGDLPASAEPQLVRAFGADRELRADVLIVPQQGSRNATGSLLLAAVRPSHAVLQVGYRNRHRHPHSAVMRRLAATTALVLRTDHDGAVQIRLRGKRKPEVLRVRRDAPPYWRIDTSG